ncbi:SDR family NAD(P)-dependent oxidoreductase [Marinicaulis aureus]|uniref:SDR family NAD(P)-dependent oxidoreductase n=1 Tax=Hyphococcus aureus TaxID=2666033 RepID=A0ABW1KY39_9PROT
MSSGKERSAAVITGAARGVGAAAARRFSDAGHDVILLDIDDAGVAVAEEVGGTFYKHNVSSAADWAALEKQMRDKHAPLQSLVNNAAIEGRFDFADIPLEKWNQTLSVNLTGAFLGSQFGVRMMRAHSVDLPCAIVNVASIGAHMTLATDAPYSASKGGLISLTKSVATYCGLKRLGIRCNVISPGAIKTEMMAQFIATSPDPAATEKALSALQPVGYMATPANIANLIHYLTTEQSEFVTGAEIVIDGGAMSSANM